MRFAPRLWFLVGVLVLGVICAQAAPPARIGLLALGSNPTDSQSPTWLQLIGSLRLLGWVEGKTALFDVGYGEGSVERLEQRAMEIARANPALVFTSGGSEAAAMRKASSHVAIVMIHGLDPVGRGYAQSLRRPGGNMTGLTLRATGMIGKQIEILRESVPRARRIAVIMGKHQPADMLREVEQAAAKFGISYIEVTPGKPEEFDALFARLLRERVDAYLAPLDALTFPHRVQFCVAAAKARMPGIAESAAYAEAGCLLSYGANLAMLSQRAAAIGDKILRGARPADVPIEAPTHFDFRINGKTARDLGIVVPPSVLVRADRVIE